MKQYQVICQSVRGESHIRRGTPREDAAGVMRLDGRIIGAVSDGHGDPRCMRSQIGSQLAVDIVLELLRGWDPEGACADAEALDARVTALAHEIIDRWNRAVATHFSENPLTEAELRDAGNMGPSYAQGRHISHIYGATLIALVCTEDSLFLLQKGDGHAVVIDKNGRVDDQVIPWDDRCYLNVTTSLCDADAPDTFTYRLLRGDEVENIAAVMLGSDGVEDSFANSDLMGAYYGLLAVECVENGEAATEAAMLRDLAEMSKYGSKDDISVVGLIDPQAVPPLKGVFERMQKRGALGLKVESGNARLSSMASAYARREQLVQAKREELEEFRRESAELAGKKKAMEEHSSLSDRFRVHALNREMDALQREIDQRNGEEARMRKRVNACTAEYDRCSRELSTVKLEYTRLCDELDNPDANPLFFAQREFALWELEDCKLRLSDIREAYAEVEDQLKREEQRLEDWQRDTHLMEQRKKRLAGELEDAKKAQPSRTEQRRGALEAEIERRAGEQKQLEQELSDLQADFEAYAGKYDAARREREQLLAEIERLKDDAASGHSDEA